MELLGRFEALPQPPNRLRRPKLNRTIQRPSLESAHYAWLEKTSLTTGEEFRHASERLACFLRRDDAVDLIQRLCRQCRRNDPAQRLAREVDALRESRLVLGLGSHRQSSTPLFHRKAYDSKC